MKIINLNKIEKNSFDEFTGWLQKDLNSVNKIIEKNLEVNAPLITKLSNYIVSSGGKRIRPLLTLATAKFLGYSGNRHHYLAAVIEFIHTATLLHDDVVDNSKKRRGKKTANYIWGNKSSILVGDFLLSKAFKILVEDGSLKCIDIISKVSEKISFGEVKQLMAVGNLNLNESDYLEIINFKTAELFSAACQIAGEISEINDIKKNCLKNFGKYLGVAYQIVDDTLDYFSDEKLSGKEIGNDFKEHKMTLPLILVFNRSNKKEKKYLEFLINKNTVSNNDLAWVIDKMERYKVLNDCLNKAKHFSIMAKDSLGLFTPNKEKDKIIDFVDFLINRTS